MTKYDKIKDGFPLLLFSGRLVERSSELGSWVTGVVLVCDRGPVPYRTISGP